MSGAPSRPKHDVKVTFNESETSVDIIVAIDVTPCHTTTGAT
jgi:hypothetical protein